MGKKGFPRKRRRDLILDQEVALDLTGMPGETGEIKAIAARRKPGTPAIPDPTPTGRTGKERK